MTDPSWFDTACHRFLQGFSSGMELAGGFASFCVIMVLLVLMFATIGVIATATGKMISVIVGREPEKPTKNTLEDL